MLNKHKEQFNVNDFEVPEGRKSCWYYFFCCFLFNNTQGDSRNYYINKWRNFLTKETDSKKIQNDPFRILTNLWAHKNVIRDLERIRLNPNLLNRKHIRNDLEFYIPQLCTFTLFGEYEKVEELLAFLCKACFASFCFSHRIVWFLKSMINPENPLNEKIRTIIHLIQTIFKSESNLDPLERLHVAFSKGYLDNLKRENLLDLYNIDKIKLFEESQNFASNENFSKKRKFREIVNNFTDKQYFEELKKENILYLSESSKDLLQKVNSPEMNLNYQVDPDYILVDIFRRYDTVTNDEDNIHTHYVKQIDTNDINLSSFLSNINFIDHLCNICEITVSTRLNEQYKTLLNELKKVNKILPCNVYLPFVNESIRNYVVAHIPLSEVKMLRTKNRIPYMITLECFRLDELTYKEDNFGLNLNSSDNDFNNLNLNPKNLNNSTSSSNEEDELRPGSDKKKNKKKSLLKISSEDEFGLQKNQSFVTSLLNPSKIKREDDVKNTRKVSEEFLQSENINLNQKSMDHNIFRGDSYVKFGDAQKKGFVEAKFNNNKNAPQVKSSKLNKINYLLESDIKISQPVVINNILNKSMPSVNNKSKNKNMNQLNSEINEDVEDYDKIEEVVKQNLDQVNNSSYLSDDNNNSSKSIESEKEGVDAIERLRNLNENFNNNKENKFSVPKIEMKEINGNCANSNAYSNLNNNNSPKIDINKIENNVTATKHDTNDIFFGENIQEQTDRLKKISPFGFLNTYKLFRIIVKNGEDLRQEQFATQLINEFFQIFKSEKVDCWIYPYEILATGNNVGIIEVVPNAVSIDQLKRKNKNINSLKNFFETYYAPVNSKRYKAAMKNFISSLAGYSLVCYFLQIKDRHNANILIDNQGHLIHIDFGFMLSNAPGKGLKFEKAPFKLTQEFVDVMGGVNSKHFSKFRKLLWKGFLAIKNNYEKILILVEMMYCGHGNKLPCFEKGHIAINELKSRFNPKSNMKVRDCMRHVDNLIEQSIDNWRTKWYDKYQYWVQGIFY